MTKEIRKEYQILSLACKTARLLLENGSEVHRIEQISKKFVNTMAILANVLPL